MARSGTGTVMQPSSLWRRRAWELAGPFDEQYQILFDVLFFVRAATFGTGVHVRQPLATYRIHADSKTANAAGLRHADEYVRVADAFYGGRNLPAAIRPHARAARAAHYRRAAWAYASSGREGQARRVLLQSLVWRPRMSRGTARLLARTLVPSSVVRLRRRLRAR
jgi:hypothetical protein